MQSHCASCEAAFKSSVWILTSYICPFIALPVALSVWNLTYWLVTHNIRCTMSQASLSYWGWDITCGNLWAWPFPKCRLCGSDHRCWLVCCRWQTSLPALNPQKMVSAGFCRLYRLTSVCYVLYYALLYRFPHILCQKWMTMLKVCVLILHKVVVNIWQPMPRCIVTLSYQKLMTLYDRWHLICLPVMHRAIIHQIIQRWQGADYQ